MSRFSHPANDGNDLLTAPAGDPRRTADRLYRVQRLSEDVAARAEALGAAVRAGGVDPLRDIVGETGVLALTATIAAARAASGLSVPADTIRDLARQAETADGRIGEAIGRGQVMSRETVVSLEQITIRWKHLVV
ncbi:hypothetical protein [Thalassobaculum sp.]|uniref:hypothetical protein n=1 Tax=Thalassobaculum sp. TaxID=2022740 RepID=UPI0032EF205F